MHTALHDSREVKEQFSMGRVEAVELEPSTDLLHSELAEGIFCTCRINWKLYFLWKEYPQKRMGKRRRASLIQVR